MKNLIRRLTELDYNSNENDRVVKQVMELEIIKYNGIACGKIMVNDNIYKIIDKVIEGFMWLYDNGLTMARTLEGVLTGEDKAYYEEFCNNFSKFNEFMQDNMSLKE